MRSIRITIVLLFLLLGVYVLLGVRLLYVQHFQRDHYLEICQKQQQKFIEIKPQRGAILDRRGRTLAASNKTYMIKAEPRVFETIDEAKVVSNELAEIIGIPAHEICIKITESKNPGFACIKKNATFEECKKAYRIHRGIGIETTWQRFYPTGRLCSHVVGFTSTDGRGLESTELKFDNILSGTSGRAVMVADAARRSLKPTEITCDVKNGTSLVLTIDTVIQKFARDALYKRWKQYEAESAVAVVAAAQTGEILAMVSLPDYDPCDIRRADPATFRNRALTDQFEPGSIMKPFTVAIALDTGVVNQNDTIFCEDGHYHGKGFGSIREYDYHKYGNLKLREVLIKSSNIGVAKLGQKIGKDRLYRGLQLFGFGKKTGFDIPGEVKGVLRSTRHWTGYSVTRIPFGQEITTTPLQITRSFCILANGGHAVTPYLCKTMVDPNGTVVKMKKPTPPVGYVIDPEAAKWVVTDALTGVVNERANGGTGWRAKLENWQVFGKTGTANIAKENAKGYSKEHYVASFIAGAPAENPQIVVLVSIRKPNKSLGKGYTGGAVSSPVVAQIIKDTLTYLEKNPL